MTARETEAVQRAVDRYQKGDNVTKAAAAEGVNRATLHRALARRGIETRGAPKGPEHHAWSGGQRAAGKPTP